MDIFAAQGKLHPTPPFDFRKTLVFLRRFPGAANEILLSHHSFAKAISVNGQVVIFRIKSVGRVDAPVLKYLLVSGQAISEEVKFAVLERASRYLSLYDNLTQFYRIGENDYKFTPVIRQLYGYHQVKFLTPFENACWGVLAQYTPLPRARQMKQMLVRHFGKSISIKNIHLYSFPEPVDLVYANIFDLQRVLGDDHRADYIQSLARAFADVDEDFLYQAPYREVYDWLLSLKGVGAWAATFIMSRGLGRTDRAPLSDRRLVDSAAKFYGEMVFAGISSIAEPYGEWQGYWAHYLHVAG